MKKIPNLFERDWNGDKSRVLPELHKGADVEWVLRGEGVPTVKWDGSAVLVRAGQLLVRFDAKNGKAKPAGFEPCQEVDPQTGHQPGWIPSEGNPAAKWHVDAFRNSGGRDLPDGTYEACGPQFQSNPHRLPANLLVRHGANVIDDLPPRPWLDAGDAFEAVRSHLAGHDIEGIVFHHPDGRMVKVLASDLGLPWKAKTRSPKPAAEMTASPGGTP